MRDKVAQLLVLPFYGEAPNSRSEEYRKYLSWVRDLRIGGLVLVNRVEYGSVRHSEPYALAAFLNRMQRAARIPLIVAGDFERGASMRVDCRTRFPHAMAFAATGDPDLSRYEGAATARQARALGLPWIFAPVADVNNNPDNPIINIRSYGEDPEGVARHVRAFIEGAHESAGAPVLVTAKHFPGHGDTGVDSHLALPVLNVDRERLKRIELVPFRAAIAAKVDAIMSAHISLPVLDDSGLPATLSPPALTGLLRKELGFDGITVTDALDMPGVSKNWPSGEAAVKAIQAGSDVLLMPPDPEAAVEAVLRAVLDGSIERRRIDESVAKILAAKVRLGLHRRRLTDPDSLMDELDTPEDLAKMQEVADRAVTLVKNERDLVPVRAGPSSCFVVLAESRGSTSGRLFAAEVRRRAPAAQVFMLDPLWSEAELAELIEKTKGCNAVVVAAFVSVAAYRGSVALAGNYPKLMAGLLDAGRAVALVALGNPYLVRSFPGVAAYLVTYSTVPPSELAAVKALFGEMPIRGRLPVSIPGVARCGDGIQLSAAHTPAAPAR